MQAIKQIYSLEEYFQSDEKFEFWEGNVWSMSDASFKHNRIAICTNLLSGYN